MTTRASRRGSFLVVATLLVLSIALEQYWIVRLLPWVSNLGGVQPMIVFLDIPLRLPVIDWIPVSLLFVFFYLIVMAPELRRDRQSLWKKGCAVVVGWWVLLVCLAAGGAIFYVLEGFLPKAVRNGIDSFGIRADIALPYPADSTIHLNGSMLLLVCLFVGGRYFLHAAALQPAVVLSKEPVIVSQPARPRPVAARTKAIPVTVIPESAIKGSMSPCVVTGEIKPAVSRVKDSRKNISQLV